MIYQSSSVEFADALRLVTALELAFAAGLAIAIFAIYFEANRHIRRADPERIGELPRYVIAIAASYILLAIFAIAEIEGYYGLPLTWRTPIGLPAATLGLYALWQMVRFQRTRLDIRDSRITTAGAPEEEKNP